MEMGFSPSPDDARRSERTNAEHFTPKTVNVLILNCNHVTNDRPCVFNTVTDTIYLNRPASATDIGPQTSSQWAEEDK